MMRLELYYILIIFLNLNYIKEMLYLIHVIDALNGFN